MILRKATEMQRNRVSETGQAISGRGQTGHASCWPDLHGMGKRPAKSAKALFGRRIVACAHRTRLGWMMFLLLNHQCQSTEGVSALV